MKPITLELNTVENGLTFGFIRCLQYRYTSRNGFIIQKKLKKSWVLNLDRQLKQLIRVFWERTLMWRKTSRPARKAQRKRAKTNSSKSGKRPKNNIRTSKMYGIVSRNAAKKFNLNKKQRLIKKRWCSRMLKKPLGFYPALVFHQKWENVLEFFGRKNIREKTQSAEKTKTK